ncbi:hypothetical protein GCM10010251_94800 [Streptomyces aurantiogriseus]|uniref:Uncharacterized protein n=1 Tax=Streptomyces aurantiogriseus TaxID=66870 RepID=A0A918FP48_9ACTN|nr:hypothetical protein GCM10010251_94800 [Streptomyces aurantiogriseus]
MCRQALKARRARAKPLPLWGCAGALTLVMWGFPNRQREGEVGVRSEVASRIVVQPIKYAECAGHRHNDAARGRQWR